MRVGTRHHERSMNANNRCATVQHPSVTCPDYPFRAILLLTLAVTLKALSTVAAAQLPQRPRNSSEVPISCCSLRNRSTLPTPLPPTATLRLSQPPHPWIRRTSDARS